MAIRGATRWLLLGAAVVLACGAGAFVALHDDDQPAGERTAAASALRRAEVAGRRLSLAWVGDTTPGSAAGLPAGDGRARYRGVRRTLRRANLAAGNLEGTLSRGGVSKCPAPKGDEGPSQCFAFQAPPRYARGLRAAGFDLMNLANNHAFDFGADGMGQTARALRRARIAVTGRPGEVRVLQRRGVRVAFVGFAAYPWASPIRDLAATRAIVAGAGRVADVVVALMHAGAEGEQATHVPAGEELAYGEPRGDARAFAHAAIDAGADLVLGSGPHVVRGLERYRGRLVAYSLGNFHGDRNFATGPVSSLSGVLTVRLKGDGTVLGGRWRSLRLVDGGRPVPDRKGASATLVRKLSREDFGRAAWPLVTSPGGLRLR